LIVVYKLKNFSTCTDVAIISVPVLRLVQDKNVVQEECQLLTSLSSTMAAAADTVFVPISRPAYRLWYNNNYMAMTHHQHLVLYIANPSERRLQHAIEKIHTYQEEGCPEDAYILKTANDPFKMVMPGLDEACPIQIE
jgi:hypothetical protein